MLSKYCFNIANEYGIKIGGVNKKVNMLLITEIFNVFVIIDETE